jgi:C4-dicarboxylate-specific signal transduction histidine kinase
MKSVLIAAGNYDIVHQARQSLGGTYYDVYTAFSHRDTLFMLRSQPMDAVLVDSAMFDRATGEKTVVGVARLSSVPSVIAYAPTASAVSAAQRLLGARSAVKFIDSLEKVALVTSLSEALRTPIPVIDDDDSKFDTSPKELVLWRDDEIQTLFALSRSLTEVLDINEVLHRVVQAARHLTDADEGILLMPDRDSGQFYLRAEVGVETEIAQTFRVRMNDSFAGEVLNTGEPVLIGPGAEPHKIKTQYFVHSLLYVPISLKGERIGVLGVNNRRKKAIFNRRHQELLMHLASYAAIAIENARVHGLSVQRAQDLTKLVEASHVINSSLSMDDTLIHISQQLHALLNGGRIDVYQWKPERRTGHSSPQERIPVALSRYRRAMWRVSYAPALSLKAHPAFTAALRNKVVSVTASRQELPEEVSYLRQVGAQGLTTVPIMADQQALGLVVAYFDHDPQSLSAQDVQHVQAVGIEILSLQVHSQETQHSHLFKSADEIRAYLNASWVEFMLLGQDRRSLLVLLSLGESVWLARPFEDPSLNAYGDMLRMLAAQETVWASANGDTSTLGSLTVLDAVHGRSMLGLPMVARGEPVGFMLFIDTERTRTFSDREINLAKAVIAQGTTAMTNADLLHRLEVSYQELKMAQDRLVRAARLSAKGELAGAVAHQVNNPLTTIVLDAELLLLNPTLDERAKESLNAILRSGKKAAAVVRRLLTTTQREHPTSPEPIAVIETIEESLSVIRSHVQRDGIRVMSRVDVYDTPFVLATRDELNDLWLNLLLNAHDALNGRRHAEMGIDVRYGVEDTFVEIIVWDNGSGISDEIIDRIFDPFFTTKPLDERTGLGLHICRQIIDRIGGDVRVNSHPATGTQFLIRLPVIKEQ